MAIRYRPRKPRPASALPPVPTLKSVARNLSTFRSSHDPGVKIPAKIRAALEKLKRTHGPQAYAYENTNPPDDTQVEPFTKLADISAAILSQYREQFLAHIVKVRQDTGSKKAPRLVWFATPAAATAARGGPADPADLK